MSRLIVLLVFLLVVVGGGFLIGFSFSAGDWYAALNKPFFTPPNEIFGIVWPILYVLIAVAGWRVFTRGGEGRAWGLWVAQLILNFAFAPVQFGAQLLGWATIIILALLLVIIGFISATWEKDRLAALCFIPYVAWVSFASILSITIWAMN